MPEEQLLNIVNHVEYNLIWKKIIEDIVRDYYHFTSCVACSVSNILERSNILGMGSEITQGSRQLCVKQIKQIATF